MSSTRIVAPVALQALRPSGDCYQLLLRHLVDQSRYTCIVHLTTLLHADTICIDSALLPPAAHQQSLKPAARCEARLLLLQGAVEELIDLVSNPDSYYGQTEIGRLPTALTLFLLATVALIGWISMRFLRTRWATLPNKNPLTQVTCLHCQTLVHICCSLLSMIWALHGTCCYGKDSCRTCIADVVAGLQFYYSI